MPTAEERYPNFNFRPPRDGRTLVIFKGRARPPKAPPPPKKRSKNPS
jgi:hypothetical protein